MLLIAQFDIAGEVHSGRTGVVLDVRETPSFARLTADAAIEVRLGVNGPICDLLYERVLPFYEALGVEVVAILTDNGREFCGKPDSTPSSSSWSWRGSSAPTCSR